MDKIVDVTKVVNKLIKAGLVQMHSKGYGGVFSIKEHSHLLEPEELEVWLMALHNGSKHDDKTCTDLHKWNVDVSGTSDLGVH